MLEPSTFSAKDFLLIGKFSVLVSAADNEPDDIDRQYVNQLKADTSYFIGRIVDIFPDSLSDSILITTCSSEFNSECRGWDYPWQGSRGSNTVEHVFVVIAYIPSPGGYTKVQTFCSPSFTISSQRRKRSKELQPMTLKASVAFKDICKTHNLRTPSMTHLRW